MKKTDEEPLIVVPPRKAEATSSMPLAHRGMGTAQTQGIPLVLLDFALTSSPLLSPATAPSWALALCSFLCGPFSQAGLPSMCLAWSVSAQPTDQKRGGSGFAGTGFSNCSACLESIITCAVILSSSGHQAPWGTGH